MRSVMIETGKKKREVFGLLGAIAWCWPTGRETAEFVKSLFALLGRDREVVESVTQIRYGLREVLALIHGGVAPTLLKSAVTERSALRLLGHLRFVNRLS